MSASLPLEITPQEAKRLLDDGEAVTFLDVREPWEHRICQLEGALLIPMGEVPTRVQELKALCNGGRLVVYCHHGGRSLSTVEWLRRQGLDQCQSLRGGIQRWSTEVDPAVACY